MQFLDCFNDVVIYWNFYMTKRGLGKGMYVIFVLDTGTDCDFCPPLPSGEGWGEGFLKSAIHGRSQYIKIFLITHKPQLISKVDLA